MTPQEYARRADAYAINSAIHRTYIHAFIGFVVAIGVLGGFVLSAVEAEEHIKTQDLRAQEARATWKQ